MNERIRELAREAGLLTHNPEGRRTKLDVFAELIVRECVDELMILHKAACDSHNYYHYAANKIKEHFGVEE